jgi:hypothetical protein
MVITLIILGLIAWYLSREQLHVLNEIPSRWFYLAVFAKVLAVFSLFGIYTYYYRDRSTSDIYKYFDDARLLIRIADDSVWEFLRVFFGLKETSQETTAVLESMRFWHKINSYGVWNDNQLIIRVDSLLMILTGGSMVASSILMGAVNFLSLLFLYRSVPLKSSIQRRVLFLLLFFSPTILIWCSGLLKETLIVTFISLAFACVFRKDVIYRWLLIPILFVLVLAKPQVGLFFIFSLGLYGMVRLFSFRRPVRVYLISASVGILLLWMNSMLTRPSYYAISSDNKEQIEIKRRSLSQSYEENVLGNGWNILEKLKFKQLGYRDEARKEGAKSIFRIKELDGTMLNFLACLPGGISNALFRPFIWEASNVLMIIPALENTLLIVILLVLLIRRTRATSFDQNTFLLLLAFVLITACFTGILVPVFGNLIRYKVTFLPIVYLLIASTDVEFNFLKKFRPNNLN